MEKYQLPYSSATIRNDMMVLEEMGLLEKTHTSSGRVPSTKGYKFYCEHLMEHRVDNQLEVAVRQQLASKPLNLDCLLYTSVGKTGRNEKRNYSITIAFSTGAYGSF